MTNYRWISGHMYAHFGDRVIRNDALADARRYREFGWSVRIIKRDDYCYSVFAWRGLGLEKRNA